MNKMKTNKLALIAAFLLIAIGSYSLGYSSAPKVNNQVEDTYNNDSYTSSRDFDLNRISRNVKNLVNKIDNEYLGEYDYRTLEEGIYKGIMNSLNDPYSVYYNEKEYKDLNEQTSGEFGGIGIQVSANEGDMIVVIAPIKGTPGEKAGILSGDKITHIEGEPIFSKDLDKAIGKMRGEPGTDVTITILREKDEKQQSFDLTITRALINVDSVLSELLENNIGYIQITGFQEKTASDFISAYESLKAKGATRFVLDLRNNPGGLLDVTMDIADYILDEAVVINVKDKNGKEEKLKTKNGKEDFMMVTLINEGSASASEVLSGALQDNGRSTIVGVKSFGKGVIQNVYPVYNGGRNEGMKLTIAEFFTPNNHKIHGVGITPDIIVELEDKESKIGVENLSTDNQLQKAIELLK